jgi:hypothetical protein
MKHITIIAYLLFSSLGWGQEPGLILGLNAGTFVANKNTAAMYNGANVSNPTIGYYRRGIESIFSDQNTKPTIDQHYQYPYELVELPIDMRYSPGINIGGMVGYRMDKGTLVYLEANFAQIKIQDVFVVEVNDPNNQIPGGTLEQSPIFAEEQRLNMNFGMQFDIFESNGFVGFMPIFGSLSSIKLESNYIVIGERQYNIFHNYSGITNAKIGGLGFGGGTGIGVRYRMVDKYSIGVQYNAIYSKTTLLEDFNPYGLHHTLSLNVIWG